MRFLTAKVDTMIKYACQEKTGLNPQLLMPIKVWTNAHSAQVIDCGSIEKDSAACVQTDVQKQRAYLLKTGFHGSKQVIYNQYSKYHECITPGLKEPTIHISILLTI